MLQDIRTVNRKIHAGYPELPVILMGHSMGSLAVRAFIAEHDSCVDMLIVCGSPSYNTAMPLGVGIAKLEKTFFGSRHRSKLIEAMLLVRALPGSEKIKHVPHGSAQILKWQENMKNLNYVDLPLRMMRILRCLS